MTILFSARLEEQYQKQLLNNFPKQNFIFKDKVKSIEEHLSDARVIVTYGGDLDKDMINKAVNLEWIMVLSAGMDQMPLKTIEEKGILVTNVRGIHKISMAEYAMSMLLYVYREEKQLTKNTLENKWEQSLSVNEIGDKTLLVVGAGAIGQEVARLGQAFRMKTLGLSRSGKQVEFFDENHKNDDLSEVLPRADFIVSVLPSTEETEGFYTLKEFKQMKEDAVFLNMGRGDAVNEADLLEAIQKKEIGHAILDVFVNEPLPEDHPFWKEDNITVTPHIAAQSDRYVPRAIDIFEKNLHTFLNDETDYINKIDVSRGY